MYQQAGFGQDERIADRAILTRMTGRPAADRDMDQCRVTRGERRAIEAERARGGGQHVVDHCIDFAEQRIKPRRAEWLALFVAVPQRILLGTEKRIVAVELDHRGAALRQQQSCRGHRLSGTKIEHLETAQHVSHPALRSAFFLDDSRNPESCRVRAVPVRRARAHR